MFIPVRIHPLFWVLAALIGWLSTTNLTLTIVWIAIIFLSVLCHEYGHALAALYFGQKSEIHLVPFGGVTKRSGERLKLSREFFIVLNGPLFGLLLYLVADTIYTYYSFPPLVAYALKVTAGVNFFWTMVNLLPVQPLDGGQLLRILLQGLFGFKGVRISLLLSVILCALIALFAVATGFMIGGALFFLLAFENYRTWKGMQEMIEKDQDKTLWQQLTVARAALDGGRRKEAWELLQRLHSDLQEGVLSNLARQMMSEILCDEQRYREAYEMIAPIIKQISPEFLEKAQLIAYHSGHLEEALFLGNEAYQANPTYEVALINAYISGKKGEVVPAVGWLRRAKCDGLPHATDVLDSKNFDAIRRSEQFQCLYDNL